MSFSSLHKAVGYLLSGLGLMALALGSELDQGTLLLIAIGYFGSFFAEEKLIHRPMYAPGWNAAVVICLLLQVARGLLTEPTLAMAIEFAAFLQISRLWNRRTAVDYQQIAVLAFLHLIAATVLSTNLSYAALFVGFVIATPWMLALSHLRREIEGNYPAQTDADPNARVAIRRVLASKRVVGPRFLAGTALLSLPLFAMTLAIFITIPRVGQGFLTFRRDQGQRVAGFGNQIELGGFGLIRDDPTVVVRVMPLPAVDERAPRLQLRLRGTSFDRYDGRRWTRSPGASQSVPRVAPNTFPIRREPDLRRDQQMQIVLDHLDEPVVFLPEGTIALSVPPRVSGGENQQRVLSYSAGLDIRYDRPDGLGLLYTAYVTRDPAEAQLLPVNAERADDYLRVPQGHERLAELARSLTAALSTDLEKAQRIERYLKHGQYGYSLEQPPIGDKPPLEAFLLDQKRGHCEYFSSAMAIMLRAIGVPTRNVTGFVGGQYNPFGGYYALRQGDAHSWVEVYLRDRGWTTFDPTPTARAAAGPRAGLWSDVNAFIDAMRTRWMTRVVGYDLRAQTGLLRKLSRMLASFRDDDGKEQRERAVRGLGLGSAAKRGLRYLALAAIAFALAWVALRLLRKPGGTGQRQLSKQQAQAAGLYGELERVLARRGHPRPAAVTPLEHARKLRQIGFGQHEEVAQVTQSYLEARYGARPLHKAELAALRGAIDRIRRAA